MRLSFHFSFSFFSFQSGFTLELFDGSVVVSAHSLIFLLSSDLQGIERQKARVDGEKERESESHQSVLMLCCVGFGLFTVKLHSWLLFVCVVVKIPPEESQRRRQNKTEEENEAVEVTPE
jgi:hypothetical protein